MSKPAKQLASKQPKWKTDADKKLFSKGPFKLKLGPKTFRFKYAEDYSAARRLISTGRFKNMADMADAVKQIPNGY